MTLKPDSRFMSIVDEVARGLVTTEHFGAGSLIRTPVNYPSGASVVVEITQQKDRFFVCDMGAGHQEAEMIGASALFSKSASTIAQNYGIRFDNQAFFVAEASRDQLAGAATIVANCSVEAVAMAAFKTAERKYEEQSDKLYQKLISIFDKREVISNTNFTGSSAHSWPVSAIVTRGASVAIFEPVSKNHMSVVNTTAKFHDFARLENPPIRISVVPRKIDMGDYINILSQAGSIIEFDVAKDAYERVAEAA